MPPANEIGVAMTMMKPDERRAMRRQQIEQFLASDMGVMEWISSTA